MTGKIFSLCSYKGGTGKSIIAANLAKQFSMEGKKTIVLDLDLKAPKQHYIFKLSCENKINDLYALVKPNIFLLNDPPIKEYVTKTNFDNLSAICCNSECDEKDWLVSDLNTESSDPIASFLFNLAIKLRREYEIIIIDGPSSFDNFVYQLLLVADTIICTTLPELDMIKNTLAFFERERPIFNEKKIDIVVNQLVYEEKRNIPRVVKETSKLIKEYRERIIDLNLFIMNFNLKYAKKTQNNRDFFFNIEDNEFFVIQEYVKTTLIDIREE